MLLSKTYLNYQPLLLIGTGDWITSQTCKDHLAATKDSATGLLFPESLPLQGNFFPIPATY